MSARRVILYLTLALLLLVLVGIPIKSQFYTQAANGILIAGRNVNMVSGTKLPLGDPWLQRQNEPSGAGSSRNPMHLFFAANDYRTIDMPDNYSLRGIPGVSAVRDSWIGVFESFNGGESFVTMLLPGFPQDTSNEAVLSPIHGFDTACDPIVRAGANGLFYLSGIAFNRSQQAGSVFLARYVDDNNREKVEKIEGSGPNYGRYMSPIRYVDTRLVDAGNPGQFIDMPNMAVDMPRGGAPFGNVYLAYTVFLGNTDLLVRSKIVFVRSTDGGATWSGQVKLTESQHVIQRPVIAIDPSDPTGKTIYVVFRRFANGNVPGGIVFVKSTDGGASFSKPADVAPLTNPFDQGTVGDAGTPITSFRTNSYPTMAVDGNGIAYVAWAQRYAQQNLTPSADGQARIVISYLPKGSLTWFPPQIVDQSYNADGHQFMPSMTCAGGKLMLIWYDQRDDIALHHPNPKFIEDVKPDHRHTIDVRAAEAPAGPGPVFADSIPVSRYLFFMQLDAKGELLRDQTGNVRVWQGEYDFSCLPLFYLGLRPFQGDYIEVASSPQILPPAAGGSWSFNTSLFEPTNFHGAWTDNRNVWPPQGNLWGDWVNYTPPNSAQDGDFGQINPCNNKDTVGTRNQNIYAASLNHGVIVGSPGNAKQLDTQRTFVVFVKDTLGVSDPDNIVNRSFLLTLEEIGGVDASFDQSADVDSLDISVPPSSSVSCTVYAGQPGTDHGFAPIRVNVTEGGSLVGRVYLNPDSLNSPILDPEGGDLGDERHNLHISDPKVWKYDVGNQNEPNASFLSPRAQNPRAQNSGFINPRAQNEGVINPRAQNSGAENPRAQNENIVNNDLLNPRAQNPSALNTALTDMTWTVTNDGNTTSAYTFNLRSTVAEYFNADPPPLIGQVLVYRVHTLPIDNGCELLQTHADELIVNVTNPRAQNPRAQNIAPTSGRIVPLAMEAAPEFGEQDVTFYLAPGEQAEVTLRVYDPDLSDGVSFEPTTVGGEVVGEAANTGETEPPWDDQPNLPWEETAQLPVVGFQPLSLSFEAALGADPPPQPLTIWNAGAGTLTYSLAATYPVTTDVPWLSVSPTSGTSTSQSDEHDHTVSVSIASLTPGTYSGTINIADPYATNNPARVPVTLILYATWPAPAKVVLTGPAKAGAGFISEAFTLTSENGAGDPTPVMQDTYFNLSSDSDGIKGFYAQNNEKTRIAQVRIPAGSSSATFCYKDVVPGHPRVVTATWASGGNNLGSAAQNIDIWPVVGQIAYSELGQGTSGIVLMQPDGTGKTILTNQPGQIFQSDWTPDGGRIAFVATVTAGDVTTEEMFVMNSDGSWVTRLTNNLLAESFPKWSPDGLRIAFTRSKTDLRFSGTGDPNCEIYIMNADGSNEIQLTDNATYDGNPTWSPDAQRIAFTSTRTGGPKIYIMNADGSGQTVLGAATFFDFGPDWSPDGSQLAITRATGGYAHIYTVNIDGTNPLQLNFDPSSGNFPRWSPDGGRIVFMSTTASTPWQISVVNADGSNLSDLTNVTNQYYVSEPSWGGSKIVFDSGRDAARAIYIMNPDGSGLTRLTSGIPYDMSADWSYDGTKIAFERFDGTSRNIWIMNADGSGAINLTNGTGTATNAGASWSPDGTRIAFYSDRDGDVEIYSISADGSGLTRLTNSPGNDALPNWSPDGTKLVFWSLRDVSPSGEIYVMNADGSNVVRLTNNAVGDSAPCWSPDGTKIAFASERDANYEIYVMNADGSSPTRLTYAPETDWDPCWSPSGKEIAFARYLRQDPSGQNIFDLYIMKADGTQVRRISDLNGYTRGPRWRTLRNRTAPEIP